VPLVPVERALPYVCLCVCVCVCVRTHTHTHIVYIHKRIHTYPHHAGSRKSLRYSGITPSRNSSSVMPEAKASRAMSIAYCVGILSKVSI
jgi:hypothetical protein